MKEAKSFGFCATRQARVFLVSWREGRPDPASVEDRAVETAVLDGLEQMGGLDAFGAGEVSDGAGDLQNAVIGAGGEGKLFHRLLEQVTGHKAGGH